MKMINKYFLSLGTILSICFIFINCANKGLKTIELKYEGANCLSQSATRIFLNDSIFVEYWKTILNESESTVKIDTFKLVKGRWLIKQCSDYEVYFDKVGFAKGYTIFIKNDECRTILKHIPQNVITENGKTIFKYKVEEQHYNYFAPTVFLMKT